ncbi:MAG: M16 family metallopeptidase [Terriglobia bacterium]
MAKGSMTWRGKKARRMPLLLVGLLLVGGLGAAAQKQYKELTYPPLRDLQLPPVERFELANGLVVYLVEDHTLPKVEGYVRVRTGSRFEPADRVGLASILGQVMRTGGTTTHPGEEIDRMLENVGASVETSVGTTVATASMFTLKENLPQVLAILADILENPVFPEDKLELAKVQERTAIARRNDDVGQIANREFTKLVYGKESPYARQTEYDTIRNITREDLVAFHRRYFHPNQALLGLWGDFDTAEMRAEVERVFGSWPRGGEEVPPLPEVPQEWTGSINFIPKDDVNQTNVRIGHVGGRFDDPDYFALNVMSEILGGGFSSRLFRRVRSDLGLAYAAFGTWNAAYDHPGMFYLRVDTKSESTVQAIEEVIKEVRRLTQEPVSPEELRLAKEGILNSFVFNFDTTGEVVRRLMTYEYYGYPSDFLERYKANVEKVTAEDVLRAARRWLRPEDLVILAVGRQQDFDRPLSALGNVNTVDISIPPPSRETAVATEATPESRVRGREVLERAIAGRGGLEALSSLRDVTVLSQITQVTPQGEFELTVKIRWQPPTKFRQDVVSPFGEVSLGYDGERAWQKSPRGVQEFPPEQEARLLAALRRSPEVLLLEAHQGEREVQYLETVTVNGSEADVIAVTDESGDTVKLYVEEGTGRILKRSFQGWSPFAGPVSEENVYSDFRAVSGLTVPFKQITFQDGKKASEQTVQSYEVNVGLGPELFSPEEGEP